MGVRGVGARSSEREATWSREGRDDVLAVEVLLVEGNVGDEDVRGRVAVGFATLLAATFRSVWRLFWNQIVTDLISLDDAISMASMSML